MLVFLLVASGLLAATIAVHAYGTMVWIRIVTRVVSREVAIRQNFWRSWALLSATGVVLMVLHFVEVVIWAETYRFLPVGDSVDSFEEAVYFSFVTFTTLGYGDVTISGEWRLLSGVQAMNGIILFGWSTALLFAVVQRLWFADDLNTMRERVERTDHADP